MENLVLIKGLILLIGILVLISGISLLVYYLFKRKMKTGKTIGYGIFSILIILLLYVLFGFPFFAFENYYFFKSTAVKELKQIDISLEDDFKILENEVTRFTSYNRTFKLKISKKDVKRSIENKTVNADHKVVFRFKTISLFTSKKVIVDAKKDILIYQFESD